MESWAQGCRDDILALFDNVPLETLDKWVVAYVLERFYPEVAYVLERFYSKVAYVLEKSCIFAQENQ